MKNSLGLMISGALILCFGAVLVFTQPAIFDFFDLTGKGEIGDAIGGITAPIINLFGAYLVYKSFKQQLIANKIQQSALNAEITNNKATNSFNINWELFKRQEKDLNKLSYSILINDTLNRQKFGEDGVYQLIAAIKQHSKFDTEFCKQFCSYIEVYNLLLRRMRVSEMDKYDTLLLNNLVINHYHFFLGVSITTLIEVINDNKSNYSGSELIILDYVSVVLTNYFKNISDLRKSNESLQESDPMFKRSPIK